jgi:signal transduction histidine kinase
MEFRHEGHDRRLQAEVERAIYRIVQEGLTNIARHAEATAGSVRLTLETSSVTVTIEDNGVGFDVADVERPGKRRGLGLLSIRERVAGLKGAVRIDSTPRRGSRIEVELPAVTPPRLHALDSQLVASLMDSEVDGG